VHQDRQYETVSSGTIDWSLTSLPVDEQQMAPLQHPEQRADRKLDILRILRIEHKRWVACRTSDFGVDNKRYLSKIDFIKAREPVHSPWSDIHPSFPFQVVGEVPPPERAKPRRDQQQAHSPTLHLPYLSPKNT
jgi:hypothetical protein